MTTDEARKQRLKNDIRNTIDTALADIAVVGVERMIAQYKHKIITADELLTYLEKIGGQEDE